MQYKRIVLRGGRLADQPREFRGIVVKQSYDNYRIFGVETSGRPGRYFD